MAEDDHRALQISITVLSSLHLVEKLLFFGYFFAQEGCSDMLLLGVSLGYLLQLLMVRVIKVSIITESKNPFPFIFAFLFTMAGLAASIAPPAAIFSQSSFHNTSSDDIAYCDLMPRLVVGLT